VGMPQFAYTQRTFLSDLPQSSEYWIDCWGSTHHIGNIPLSDQQK